MKTLIGFLNNISMYINIMGVGYTRHAIWFYRRFHNSTPIPIIVFNLKLKLKAVVCNINYLSNNANYYILNN